MHGDAHTATRERGGRTMADGWGHRSPISKSTIGRRECLRGFGGGARAAARACRLGPDVRGGVLAAALALALSSAFVATAAAARPPSAGTGGATAVGFGSATLNGAVNPRGSDTSYYFQYGPTKAYGLQTGILDAGGGSKGVHVA